MKLTVLTNILAPYRIPLFEALRQRVDNFTVLLMAREHEDRQWALDQHKFETIYLPGFHFRPRGHLISLHLNFGVIRALRKLDPDVVVSGGFAPGNISAFLYCKLYRKKYVGWGELTLNDGAESSLVRRTIRRLLTTFSDGSIAASSDSRDAFLHYGAKQNEVMVSLMPIDTEKFHQSAATFRHSTNCEKLKHKFTRPILLSIGRLIDIKGYDELFKIYGLVQQERPATSLLIVGDGPKRQAYEELVRNNRWGNVHFIGFQQADKLAQYLAIADLFVFHTLYDPFGAVLSEAMSAELPVISSIYACATRDLVEDGATGFRIDPRDISSSAATILKAINMKTDDRVAMIKNAYERVSHTNCEESAEAMIDFIKRIVLRYA